MSESLSVSKDRCSYIYNDACIDCFTTDSFEVPLVMSDLPNCLCSAMGVSMTSRSKTVLRFFFGSSRIVKVLILESGIFFPRVIQILGKWEQATVKIL